MSFGLKEEMIFSASERAKAICSLVRLPELPDELGLQGACRLLILAIFRTAGQCLLTNLAIVEA